MRKKRSAPSGGRETTIGLIAHRDKRKDAELLIRAHLGILSGVNLVAPAATALALGSIPVNVEKQEATSADGAFEIATRILDMAIDGLIFLFPPPRRPDDSDIASLVTLCNVKGVPIATSVSSADALLHRLISGPRSCANKLSRRAPSPRDLEARLVPFRAPAGLGRC